MHIRVPSYGDVEGVDYLDTDKQMGVWNSTIAVLKALGYQVGEAYKTFYLLLTLSSAILILHLLLCRQKLESCTV